MQLNQGGSLPIDSPSPFARRPKIVAQTRSFRLNFRNTLAHGVKQAPYCDISPSYGETLRGMISMLEAEMLVKGDKL